MSEPNTLDSLVAAARERLLARAHEADLAAIGYHVIDSPVGPLWVALSSRGVAAVYFGREPSALALSRLVRTHGPGLLPDPRRTSRLAQELDEYFSGRRKRFAVSIDLRGVRPFQRKVLQATAKIPFGALTTYGAIARQVDHAKASRATGQALNKNPLPILIPCHRVVANDGSMHGYAGGVETKRILLAIEAAGT